MTKISVIIPCYNAEQYIEECLESVTSQTLREIDIICIDDGSTDGTLKILKEYQRRVGNLQILCQKNQGSGIARNQGIKVASGEYIAFMDADDFYPSIDTLEKVYHAAKERDAEICGGSACTYRNGVYTYKGLRKGYVFSENGWINKKDFPTMTAYWRFIYKNDFIKKNQIYFPDYLRCQDPPFLLTAVANAARVYCLKEVTYVYRKEHKQVSFTPNQAIGYAKGMCDSLEISKKEGMDTVYLQLVSELQGEISALMYLFAENCEEIRSTIHRINILVHDSSDSKDQIPWLKEGEEIAEYLKCVQVEKEQLLKELKKEKRILIFGAGTIGKKVWPFLEKNGIVAEAFVVSDTNQNATSLDGLQIRCIDDYINEKDNCVVIIATFPYLQEEIGELLQEKGFENVYPLSLEKFYLFEGRVVH